MSKNSAFNKQQQTVQTDPIAQAQQDAVKASTESVSTTDVPGETQVHSPSEQTDQETTKVETTQGTGVVNIAQLTTNPVTVTSVKAEADKPKQSGPVVKDTTVVNKPAAEKTPQVQRGRQDPNSVKRGAGASPRQASPETSVDAFKQPVSNSFSSLIASEKVNGTAWAVDVIGFFERYVEAMAPRRIIPGADVVKWQEGLLDKVVAIIERSPSTEFSRLWRIVINFFGEYKTGCFSPVYYSRGADEWKRDPKQFQILSNLVNLLEASARDMKTVNQVVNVNAVVGKNFSEEGRGRVISFYLK